MRTYDITIKRRDRGGWFQPWTEQAFTVTSESQMRAVLIALFEQYFGRHPQSWWSCKNVNMGQAWNTPSMEHATRFVEIFQVHRDELAERAPWDHLWTVYNTPLLTERRAA